MIDRFILTANLFVLAAISGNLSYAEFESSQTKPTNNSPSESHSPLEGNLGRLPWSTVPDSNPLRIRRETSARQMLDLFGIDDSQIQSFIDGQPLLDSNEALIKLLYRFPRFGLDNISKWLQETKNANLQDVAKDVDIYRLRFLRIAGHISDFKQVALLPEQKQLLEYPHFYRITLQSTNDKPTVVICTRNIPQAWIDKNVLGQYCHADGLLLQSGPAQDGNNQLIFAAQQIAWHPESVSDELGINRHHLLLSQLGMDAGLFENIKQLNRQPLLAKDRESFYQMLAACNHPAFQDLPSNQSAAIDLVALLKESTSFHGQLTAFRGHARQISRVAVEDSDIRTRFGIDHYYQIDVFLPLGDVSIHLGNTQQGDSGPVFKNSFPATVCVRTLPPSLQHVTDKLNNRSVEIEALNEQFEVTGFFYRLWSYRSEYMSQFDTRQRQFAPMFIANSLQQIDHDSTSDPIIGLIAGGLFILGIGITWLGLWRKSRGDAEFKRKKLQPQFALPADKSLNDLEIESSDGPDFSGIHE